MVASLSEVLRVWSSIERSSHCCKQDVDDIYDRELLCYRLIIAVILWETQSNKRKCDKNYRDSELCNTLLSFLKSFSVTFYFGAQHKMMMDAEKIVLAWFITIISMDLKPQATTFLALCTSLILAMVDSQ
jgi:hypothetical protein